MVSPERCVKGNKAESVRSGLHPEMALLPERVVDADVAVAATGDAARLSHALSRLNSAAALIELLSAAILSLLPEMHAERVGALGRECPGELYSAAVALVSADRVEDAVLLLAALLDEPGGRADALVGLAVCAFRLEVYDAALTIAVESLVGDVKHPRACCIAGLCELERGDRKAAQNYFAAAARLARARPEFRNDLQTAQRALLLMHLS
jgi:tetratricopeptide (TPR) repeat protein